MPIDDAILHTSSGAHPLRVRTATHFFSRFAGLMLTPRLPPGHALLLTGCPSIHTAFMRYAIDVVYVDHAGIVLKCVANLKPWRASVSRSGRDVGGKPYPKAAHTLELAAGDIARFAIQPGDRLQHRRLDSLHPQARTHQDAASTAAQDPTPLRLSARNRQRGAAMVEFIVVGPIITLLGLASLQYGMLFFAKNQINHAGFMAARAGSTSNADLTVIENTYIKAIMPIYGGGTNGAELVTALAKARQDLIGSPAGPMLDIAMLNPTRESFDDWHDPSLQGAVGGGRRVIPNTDLASRNPADIGPASGQNIHDANLIKLRITHGYEPKVPLMGLIYTRYLRWMDTGTDAVHTRVVNAGRIPVVTHVTMHMQSDAIEPGSPLSIPGAGNNGAPTDPGNPPVTTDPPPNCLSIGCSVTYPPVTPTDPGGGGSGGGGTCQGTDCPVCS